VIELRGVGHVYSAGTPWAHRALEGVDLRLADGERVVVIGANGSGKSTLAWILAGLLRPSEGTVTIDGDPIDLADGLTAMAFQHARLQLLRPTVAEDVGYGLDPNEADVDGALAGVGLDATSFRTRRIDDLSGGEQRRVALAGVLARRPRLLVLDEPLAGLDLPARRSLVEVLQRPSEMTTVIVTHDTQDVALLTRRALALREGRVVADGPVDDVLPAVAS